MAGVDAVGGQGGLTAEAVLGCAGGQVDLLVGEVALGGAGGQAALGYVGDQAALLAGQVALGYVGDQSALLAGEVALGCVGGQAALLAAAGYPDAYAVGYPAAFAAAYASVYSDGFSQASQYIGMRRMVGTMGFPIDRVSRHQPLVDTLGGRISGVLLVMGEL